MIGLGFEMGFIIALPLLIFIRLGKYIDDNLNIYPFGTFGGIVIAMTTTVVWLMRRLRPYLKG